MRVYVKTLKDATANIYKIRKKIGKNTEQAEVPVSARFSGRSATAFGAGTLNTAYAKYFIGDSFLNPLTDPSGDLFAANATFEPGCRNNWHIHHASAGGGQLLLCTAGEGWYQEEGKPAVSLHEGSVVMIPANVKHWHGAKKDIWFSHIAVEVPGENCKNEWCEPVSDEEYHKLYSRRFSLRSAASALILGAARSLGQQGDAL